MKICSDTKDCQLFGLNSYIQNDQVTLHKAQVRLDYYELSLNSPDNLIIAKFQDLDKVFSEISRMNHLMHLRV